LTDVYDSANHLLNVTSSGDVGITGGSVGLVSGSSTIGNVGLVTGSATIGSVGLVAGTANVGNVGITSGSVGLVAGSATIGNVGINSGSNTIGNVGINAGSNLIGTVGITSGSVGLVAGENLIGKIGQPYSTVSVTPTITSGAYSANDGIGGKMTLSNALRTSNAGGTWQSLLVSDKNNQKAQLNVLLFNYDPTSGSYTDNSPLILGSDISKLIRNVTINASDYQTVAGSVAIADINVMQTVNGGSTNGTLYAVAMTPGTPSYASTSDITFQFGFQQG
jgi:hypothetical protein